MSSKAHYVRVSPKKGPHGLDGAVEKYFRKGENASRSR